MEAYFLSVIWRQEAVRTAEVKMYYFYSIVNQGHIECPLFGGGLYLQDEMFPVCMCACVCVCVCMLVWQARPFSLPFCREGSSLPD